MKSLIATLALMSLSVLSHAKSMPVDPNARLKIGANASFDQTAYAQENTVSVLPQAFYDNNRVYLEGSEAGFYGYKDAQNQWRLTLGYEGRSYDPAKGDTPALQTLDEREWTAMLGTSYMRITPYGGFKGQVETDVLGRSKGTAVSASYLSKFNPVNNLTLYPELGLRWYDDKYNQYYFGVSQEEALKSGIKAYDAKAGISPYVNLTANYEFSPQWSGFISQSLEYLSDSQQDSPLVDSQIDSQTKVGFNYQF